jgi:hypothetical protein
MQEREEETMELPPVLKETAGHPPVRKEASGQPPPVQKEEEEAEQLPERMQHL